jgi:dihydropteroate synthase
LGSDQTCRPDVDEGAAILDLGAASSSPGAGLIDPEKEKKRLLPALELVLKNFPDAIVSIDTYNAATAEAAIKNGAHMINDISAGSVDSCMHETIAQLQVPYVIMHMKGVPETMQNNPAYDDPSQGDCILFFAENRSTESNWGFMILLLILDLDLGSRLTDNYRIMEKLEYFKILELPVMLEFHESP